MIGIAKTDALRGREEGALLRHVGLIGTGFSPGRCSGVRAGLARFRGQRGHGSVRFSQGCRSTARAARDRGLSGSGGLLDNTFHGILQGFDRFARVHIAGSTPHTPPEPRRSYEPGTQGAHPPVINCYVAAMTETPISVQDALWLNMDRPNNLMIIDSLMWLRDQPDWDAVKQVVDERMVQRFPVFSSIAQRHGDGYVWVADPDFDVDNHIRFAPLEEPHLADVKAYVASQRSVPLPADRPLWQFHLIENVTDDAGNDLGAVILSRIHHSIADGIRLVQVTLGLCDPVDGDASVEATVGRTSEAPSKPSLTEFTRQTVGGATGVVRDQVGRAVSAAVDPVGTVKTVVSGGQDLVDDALGLIGDPSRFVDAFSALAPVPDEATNTLASVAKLGLSGPSIETIWSGTPGVEKTAEWVDPMSLERIKEIGKRTQTTVNDVLLTMVAGTLQRYLAEHDAHVDEVMWMIPVSVKPFDPGMPKELGNHFALIAFQMPLNIDDPKQRLFEVNRRINRIKNSQEAVITFGVQRVISQTPERLSVFLTNFFANKAVGVLTNVPGPRSEMTLAGTPVEAMLGWAPCSGDQPMTICIFSYNGRVHVGFGTDAKLVPDAQRLPQIFAEQARHLYSTVTGKDPAL